MQKQIRFLYNPYENKIEFLISQDGGESWNKLSENSDLRHFENQDCVLANCAEDIVALINRYQNVSAEGVLICFEGTEEDFEILQEVVRNENAINPKKGRDILSRDLRKLLMELYLLGSKNIQSFC